MEWRNELLQGVTALPKIGSPGRIVVFGENAEPILTGLHEEDVVIAAAKYGQGRVIAFSQDGYPEKLFQADSGSGDSMSIFNSNVRRWIIPGVDYNGEQDYVDLSDWNNGEDQLAAAKVAIWKGGSAGQIETPRVLQYIQEGGGFVHAMTPWGWLQMNPGKKLKEMPYWDVLKAVGLCYTDDFLNCSSSELLIPENKASNAHLMKFLRANSNNPSELMSRAGLVRTLNSLPKDIRDEEEMKSTINSLWQTCSSKAAEDCPSPATPTTSHEQVSTIDLWKACVDAQKLTGVKAPGCDRFPGDFSSSPPLKCVSVEFSANREEIHSTGVYAPAGQVIQVDVLSGSSDDKWTLLVGAHKDILSGDSLRRWPNVQITKKLTKTSHSLSSPFGGLVYLQSPNAVNSFIRVQLSNVVDAPQFTLGNGAADEGALNAWNARRSAPGLWADIIGRHMTVTLPSASVSSIDNPSEAMLLWDQVVQLYHELRGTDINQYRRMWTVADEQPSAGYMHCGYPIVTHLDVADPDNAEFMLNATNLREKGFWGMFHEIGHNMQRPEWTFGGTVEVTVNIFTMYAMDALCGRPPWIHEWLQIQFPAAVEYLTNGADFNEWKSKPGTALFIYAQLVRDFGWDSYRAVFRRYEAMTDQQKPGNDQQKMDEWFCQFSEVSSHNLSPLAQFWGIPLTPEAGMKMSRFPAYLPDDEITKAVPVRTDFIVLIFPGIIRNP